MFINPVIITTVFLRVYSLVIARDPGVAAAQNNPVHKKRPRFLNIDASHMFCLMTISSYSYYNFI